ncbi:MerR family DNA-binding transcriptional regulator [candidate division WWE3 bacterium]|nr:MerR family DNA-binding transcriptional regulator [candidate division WWE3 bacterium]
MRKQRLSIGKAADYLNVSIDTLRRWDKKGKLPANRTKGGHRFYYKHNLELYKKNIFALAKEWLLNKPAEPSQKFYCPTSLEFKQKLSLLEKNLKRRKKFAKDYPLIVAIAGEIGNNSYDHNLGNWPDISGSFFANNINKKQIALADRGQGILRTLGRVKENIQSDKEALYIAFTKVISGRAPETRGNGLKFVRNVILQSEIKLSLEFYSGKGRAVFMSGNEKGMFSTIDTYYPGCLALLKF